MKIEGLAHVGLFVPNAESTAAFYKKYLGFEEIWRVVNHFQDGDETVIFIQNGGLTVEIVQQVHPQRRQDGWFDHIALAVTDLDSVIEKLRDGGITFEEGSYTIAPHVFPNGSKWILFRGPNQEHLELTEVLS